MREGHKIVTTRILHIEASPSAARSRSAETARHFLQQHRALHPDVEIETLRLWDLDLPAFDATMIEAKFAVLRAANATEEQKRHWQKAVRLARAFNAADKYVFSLPMWNFGIPYILKHYIDVVTLPGENWLWTPQEGYSGLLHGKRAALIYSSAGDYPVGLPSLDKDFQKPYMRTWLGFLGIDEILEITAAPTLASPEAVSASLARARNEAERLAERF
ncbi:ACP phosphodiesterase [Variovorax gossypii]|uniref:FMN dependent NADH:quinone oxidoreductase n=1 Tax=Variovorax gossypii TaxID=1679495 RepID=A0A3S0IHT7_9BURK|nr:ACP phosphodiesterase [Variovorax gossypii]